MKLLWYIYFLICITPINSYTSCKKKEHIIYDIEQGKHQDNDIVNKTIQLPILPLDIWMLIGSFLAGNDRALEFILQHCTLTSYRSDEIIINYIESCGKDPLLFFNAMPIDNGNKKTLSCSLEKLQVSFEPLIKDLQQGSLNNLDILIKQQLREYMDFSFMMLPKISTLRLLSLSEINQLNKQVNYCRYVLSYLISKNRPSKLSSYHCPTLCKCLKGFGLCFYILGTVIAILHTFKNAYNQHTSSILNCTELQRQKCGGFFLDCNNQDTKQCCDSKAVQQCTDAHSIDYSTPVIIGICCVGVPVLAWLMTKIAFLYKNRVSDEVLSKIIQDHQALTQFQKELRHNLLISQKSNIRNSTYATSLQETRDFDHSYRFLTSEMRSEAYLY